MKCISYVSSVLVFFILASCGTVNKLDQGAHLARYKADKRGSLIFIKGNRATMLSEVQPDAIISSVMKFTNSIKVDGKFSTDQVVDITEAVTELGERTEAVNILRDALYRLAEIRNSDDQIDSVTQEIFISIVETAKIIATADAEQSKAENAKALSELTAEKNAFIDKIGREEFLKLIKTKN